MRQLPWHRGETVELMGPAAPEPFVVVDGDPVLVDEGVLRIGDLRYRLTDVSEYARQGANIPLHEGKCVQAAVALLVAVAAGWSPPPEDWFGLILDPDVPRVVDVQPDSPGAAAGVRAGEEIVAIGGVSAALHPEKGDHLALRLARDGTQFQVALQAEADELPESLNCKAREFLASTVRGDLISIAQLTGQVVVLDFWKPEDALCQGKLPPLAELHATCPDLRLFGISRDVPVRTETVAVPEYPLIHDKDGSIYEAYEADLPMLVVIDREGVVRKIESGVPDFQRLQAELMTLLGRPVA